MAVRPCGDSIAKAPGRGSGRTWIHGVSCLLDQTRSWGKVVVRGLCGFGSEFLIFSEKILMADTPRGRCTSRRCCPLDRSLRHRRAKDCRRGRSNRLNHRERRARCRIRASLPSRRCPPGIAGSIRLPRSTRHRCISKIFVQVVNKVTAKQPEVSRRVGPSDRTCARRRPIVRSSQSLSSIVARRVNDIRPADPRPLAIRIFP